MGNNCCSTKAKLQRVGPTIEQKKPEWRKMTTYQEPPVEVEKKVVQKPIRAKQGKVEGWSLKAASLESIPVSQLSDNSSDLSTAESDLKSAEANGLQVESWTGTSHQTNVVYLHDMRYIKGTIKEMLDKQGLVCGFSVNFDGRVYSFNDDWADVKFRGEKVSFEDRKYGWTVTLEWVHPHHKYWLAIEGARHPALNRPRTIALTGEEPRVCRSHTYPNYSQTLRRQVFVLVIDSKSTLTVTAEHNAQTEVLTAQIGEQNVPVMKLDVSLANLKESMPLELRDEEYGVDVKLDFSNDLDRFTLGVEDVTFEDLQYQEAPKTEEQTLDVDLTINNVSVHEGEMPWSPHAFQHLIYNVLGDKPLTSVIIKDLKSSASVTNSMLKSICSLQTSAPTSGLKKLALQNWQVLDGTPDQSLLEALAQMSRQVQKLVVTDMSDESASAPDMRKGLAQLAASIMDSSQALTQLDLEGFSEEQDHQGLEGQFVLSALSKLASEQISSLNLSQNASWSTGHNYSDSNIDLLCQVLAKQKYLTKLNLNHSGLSTTQVEKVLESLINSPAKATLKELSLFEAGDLSSSSTVSVQNNLTSLKESGVEIKQ